jgi:ERCC4-type nuclease
MKQLSSVPETSPILCSTDEVPEDIENFSQIWIKMLTGIPGINQRKAMAIIEHFGSLKNLMQEDADTKLQQVCGIGAKLAIRISGVLGLEKRNATVES